MSSLVQRPNVSEFRHRFRWLVLFVLIAFVPWGGVPAIFRC